MTLMMERHDPHYILLHSCSIDTLGHTFGGDSREYRRQVWQVDNALSRAIPTWQALGYDIIVTADHGMTEDHWHGGTSKMATEVACYLFSDVDGPAPEEELHQTSLAASVLKLLGIERPEDAKMRPSFL
jgi:bisphosphoglycerate-independent phosphoglycerate mutase (AlkP superfamily)